MKSVSAWACRHGLTENHAVSADVSEGACPKTIRGQAGVRSHCAP